MRLGLFHNPAAGYAQGAPLAALFQAALERAGHAVAPFHVGPGLPAPPEGSLGALDAMILLGGDGTVHHALPWAIRSRTPIYHVPTGTENLFARDWGMSASPRVLLDALAAVRPASTDAADCNGRLFALMVGIGFDAAVLHARAAAPHPGSGHRAYVVPILQALAEPVLPTLRILADGRPVIDGRRGIAVIANSRQYAMRLDPAHPAVPNDGLLDLVFLPCASGAQAVAWTLLMRLRRHLRMPGALHVRAASFAVSPLDGPSPVQIDGEPLWAQPPHIANGRPRAPLHPESLTISILPGALRVIDARPPARILP